jgi:hypothetical protein
MSETTTTTEAPTTEAPAAVEATTEETLPAYTPPASQAELDRIIAERLRRQKAQFADYDELKSRAERLAEIEEANKTETEKAIERARAEAATEVTATFAQRLAAAEIKAQLAGLVESPESIVEDLNLAKYVTTTGEVDAEAVSALRDKYAGLLKAVPKVRGDADQGVRGGGSPATFTRAQLRDTAFFRANEAAILQAQREGRITD